MNVALLCGSVRARSSNRELLRAAEMIGAQEHCFEWCAELDTLPHFNPDREEANDLDTAAPLRATVARADALIICSPEYAHGVPGALKNALDWLVGGPEMVGKPVAVWEASTGLEYAPAQLRETLRTMSADVRDDATVVLSLRGGARDAAVICTNSDMVAVIRAAFNRLATQSRGSDGS